jgi:hypothetical protein
MYDDLLDRVLDERDDRDFAHGLDLAVADIARIS